MAIAATTASVAALEPAMIEMFVRVERPVAGAAVGGAAWVAGPASPAGAFCPHRHEGTRRGTERPHCGHVHTN
jgi:hypothetical protein